jgi:dihydrofolate reductase
MPNIVYIATSIDGYIAGKNGDIKWLIEFPNPEGSDYGFLDFMKGIDALIMGRHTFETVNGFDTWMYNKPVFVISNTLTELTGKWAEKAELIKGDLKEVVAQLNAKGINNIYVDGGKTIQSFMALDMIDKLIITTIPIVLGGGIPLFGESAQLNFKHESTEIYTGGLVKNTFTRDRGV